MTRKQIEDWMFILVRAYLMTEDKEECEFYDIWKMELHAAYYGLRVEGTCR